MKVLIASGAGGGTAKKSVGKFFHLKELGEALKRIGVDYKLVSETDYITGFPSKDVKSWFSKKKYYELINEYNPDVVFVDRQSHFGLETIKAGIPLFVYLRGHFWMEQEWAKKTIYKDPVMKTVVNLRAKIAERVFKECQGILMTGDYLEGLDTTRWYPEEGMKLNHPCVGMLHDANWWGKTKEMLTLEDVVRKLPQVHFYWAGDGQYKTEILDVLDKFENFHYLGSLDYPDEVRKYLTEIDIYALPTGMDTTPLSCRESMSMKNPTVATNVGGIPEMIYNDKTGFLVEEGDSEAWIEKISLLINDKEMREKLGKNARELVIEKFNWDKLSKTFVEIVKPFVKKKA